MSIILTNDRVRRYLFFCAVNKISSSLNVDYIFDKHKTSMVFYVLLISSIFPFVTRVSISFFINMIISIKTIFIIFLIIEPSTGSKTYL